MNIKALLGPPIASLFVFLLMPVAATVGLFTLLLGAAVFWMYVIHNLLARLGRSRGDIGRFPVAERAGPDDGRGYPGQYALHD